MFLNIPHAAVVENNYVYFRAVNVKYVQYTEFVLKMFKFTLMRKIFVQQLLVLS